MTTLSQTYPNSVINWVYAMYTRWCLTPIITSKTPFLKANGGIRTHNPWFTKPELYR